MSTVALIIESPATVLTLPGDFDVRPDSFPLLDRKDTMNGIELRGGLLIVERAPNQPDEFAIESSAILYRFSIDHV